MDGGSGLGPVLFSIVVIIAIFLAFREPICWYWKINKGVGLLDEMNEQQDKLTTLLEKTNERLDSVCEELVMLRQQQLELSVRQKMPGQDLGDA